VLLGVRARFAAVGVLEVTGAVKRRFLGMCEEGKRIGGQWRRAEEMTPARVVTDV
jgi:hypothetical protein